MSPAQQRACDELLPRYGVDACARRSIGARVFGRARQSCWRSASAWARRPPPSRPRSRDVDFLGVEMHLPGVGALLRRARRRAAHERARPAARCRRSRRDMIAPASLAGIHVYFPDPWPKKRHHKRRLLQPAFVHALAARLAPGGYLHVATDWAALRRGNPRRASRPSRCWQYLRRLRAAPGVAAADQVRAARHRARPRSVRPAVQRR